MAKPQNPRLEITLSRGNEHTFLIFKGHAGANKGSNVVCAAISALILFFVKAGKEMGLLFYKAIVREGHAELAWKEPAEPTLKKFTETFIRSLKEIAEENPQSVIFRTPDF